MRDQNNYRAAELEPFFTVPKSRFKTSDGDIDLPICYYDNSAFIALFTANMEEVEQQLEGTGLKPSLTILGKPVIALICYEYRSTAIGSYNEVGVTILTCPKSEKTGLNRWVDLLRSAEEKHSGAYVINLPVTTEAACTAGIEVWGYPKFVTPISFKMDAKSFKCNVNDVNGKDNIMTLSGKSYPYLPSPSMDIMSYSFKDDNAFRAHVNVRGKHWVRTSSFLKLTVGASNHLMAKNLRNLGLDGAKPFAAVSTNNFQSRLNEGAEISLPK